MHIAILSYSYTGNNEALAESVARELEAKHIKVTVRKPVTMGSIVLDVLFSRIPKIQPDPDSLRNYDLILFFRARLDGQGGLPAPGVSKRAETGSETIRLFIHQRRGRRQKPKLSNELLRRTGKQPVILVDQHIADLLSSNDSTTRKETSAYRLNEEDVNRLTKVAVERIKQSFCRPKGTESQFKASACKCLSRKQAVIGTQ